MSDAYTLRRKSLLAIKLSWVGGFTNVLAVLTCGQTVSHQTGNTTHFGHDLADLFRGHASGETSVVGFIVLMFFAGSGISGLLTEWARRSGHSIRYLIPITLEAVLLSATLILLSLRPDPLHGGPMYPIVGMAALAMGLQNATITRISGSVVRTTHLTGVITDMGIESARLVFAGVDRLRHRPSSAIVNHSPLHPSAQRLAVLTAILGSFLVGAVLGGLSFEWIGSLGLLFPIAFLFQMILRGLLARIGDIKRIEPSASIRAAAVPGTSFFRIAARRAGPHRSPDLASWVEALPAVCAVAILQVDPATLIDRDAAAGMLSAIAQRRSVGRRLIIAGVDVDGDHPLRTRPAGQAFNPDDFATDVEQAVAKSLL